MAFHDLLIDFQVFKDCYVSESTEQLDQRYGLERKHQDCSEFLDKILKDK